MFGTGSPVGDAWSVAVAASAQQRSEQFVILWPKEGAALVVQDGGSAESAMPEVSQCPWCLTHGIPHGCRAYAEPLRQAKKRLPIRARVRGHRSQFALLKESLVVIQRGNVGQPDPCYSKRSAPIECS